MPALRKKFLRERPIYYFIPAIVVLGILAVYPLFNNVWFSLPKVTIHLQFSIIRDF